MVTNGDGKMNNDMKCPFCQQKMSKSENNMFYCGTYNCSLRYIEMPKKAVEDFAESYQDRLNDCKKICNLNEELIRTRKALDAAMDALNKIANTDIKVIEKEPLYYARAMFSVTNNALGRIQNIKQKDVK